MRAQVERIMDLGAQVEDNRRQLTRLIARTVNKNRMLAQRTLRPAKRRKAQRKGKRRVTMNKPRRRAKPKDRAKR